MELPHFHVLHGNACTQCHARAVTGIHECIRGRRVDTARAACGEHDGLRLDVDDLAGLDLQGDDARHRTILIRDEIDREPLRQEGGVGLEILLVERMQQGVSGPVRRSAGARRLTTLAEVLRLSAKGTLVDAACLGSRERQPHVLELEDSLGADGAHVFDRVLIANVVRPLDGVVHVPAPIVVRVIRGNCARDPALRRDGVRARRKHLRHAGGLQAALRQLQRRAHAGATAPDDDGIERHGSDVGHAYKLQKRSTPQAT